MSTDILDKANDNLDKSGGRFKLVWNGRQACLLRFARKPATPICPGFGGSL